MYYEQEYNQQQIANRLHLSRPKVSRLLKQAREVGIVQISVVSPTENFIELEKNLEEKFGLKEVLIVETDTQASGKVLKKQIGTAAANYLHRTISNGDTIGVSWGTTLEAVIDALPPKQTEDTHIVQALGGVGPPEDKAHTTDISRRLSQLLGSRLTLLPAPGIVGSTNAKEVLLDDRQVKVALSTFPSINRLFVGLGAIQTNPVLDEDSKEVPPGLYKEITASKAVGDIALRFFDVEGNPVSSTLDDLTIGITIDQIKAIDTVVGIAGGVEKREVILGALRGKFIDVLITDSRTAEMVLEG
ncbi:transcriptional regulator [Gracilimonas mengyeensis]|uniref:Transcriptional regulator n=2 Tax=Gracilimonas mengyeensis TaxID=1302730 RepID=A0A521C360_9BACT|nr:transcriptional regulator [Gracilimonas mengyeensis]